MLIKIQKSFKKGGKILLIENDEGREFEEIPTYFDFQSFEECVNCFRIIYGERVLSKINDSFIEHHIILFSFYNA